MEIAGYQALRSDSVGSILKSNNHYLLAKLENLMRKMFFNRDLNPPQFPEDPYIKLVLKSFECYLHFSTCAISTSFIIAWANIMETNSNKHKNCDQMTKKVQAACAGRENNRIEKHFICWRRRNRIYSARVTTQTK